MSEKELKPRELVLAATVARRFFIEGKAKTEIGAELGISRFRVARIIDQARESGLVRIEIVLPAEIDADLSERLRTSFGLRHAVAVRTSDQPEESLRSHLGAVTAGLLSEIVEEGDILGVGWGRTLDAMSASLKKLAPCAVVQLTGAAATVDVTEDSVEVVRRVAAVSGGPAFPIYAPLIVDTAEAATALRRQPHVAEALRRFDRVSKAVVAIGSWEPPNSQLQNSLDHVTRDALRKKRVRAEVCSTLIDDDGQQILGDLMDRSISISAEQLRRVPEVVAVAGGRSKVAAIRAVLKAGFVTSLVTDTGAGEALVSMAGRAPDPRSRPARRR